MSRPTFYLSDDQARALRDALPTILVRHPPGAPSHRPFVRDFMRALYDATGQTYGPSIVRRLLDVYAPDRCPSTDTLASEKVHLDNALAQEARAGRRLDNEAGEDLTAVIARAVEHALAIRPPQQAPVHAGGDMFLLAQRDFLQTRLLEAEQALQQVRTLAARQAAELQAAQAVRDMLQVQVGELHAAAQAQSARIGQLTDEMAGMRTFALRAIDVSRGETRAQQERATHLAALLQAEKQHTEVFRRLAYRNGAPIPASLQPDPKP